MTAHRLRDDLAADPRTLSLLLARPPAGSAERARVCVLVDQAEELFTLCRDERERALFLGNLMHAGAADGPACVLLTLRADFYARLAEYPELAQQASAHQYLVGPLDREGVEAAIAEPAHVVSLELEPGLVEQILDDVGSEPGSLPLLEHTLFELWQRRRGRLLTLEAYREVGGVDGALATRADEIYAGLGPEGQTLARRILLRLTQPGEGSEDTRRRATLAELVPHPQEQAAVEEVVGSLADARLLTTSTEETSGERMVEVSHEALIRGWPRLRAWVEEGRAGLRVHRQLTEDALAWQGAGRDPSSLYRGARLAVAREWAQDRDEELNELERGFLGASYASERRGRRVRRAFVGVLAVLLAATAVFAAMAVMRGSDAREQARVASSRALAAESIANLEPRIDVGLLLALEAYQEKPTVEARNALVRAAQASGRLRTVLSLEQTATASLRGLPPAGGLILSPDGNYLAAGSEDGPVRVSNVSSPQATVTELRGHRGGATAVAFNPDSRTLASGGDDETIRLWNVPSATQIGQPLRGHEGGVAAVAFSPNGRTLASGGADGTVRLWTVATGRQLGRPLGGHDGVAGVVFSPDGRTLASGGDDETIRLWDVATGRPIGRPLRGHDDRVWALAFSPDGRTLASGSVDRTIRLWDVRSRQPVGDPLRGHQEAVHSVAFEREGKTLVTRSLDRTIRIWDVASRPLLGRPLAGGNLVYGVAFSPGGKTLASGESDGTVRIRDIATGRVLGRLLGGHDGSVGSVAFSPDGATLASGGDDETIRLWDVSSRRPLGKPLRGHGDTVVDLAFSPDGSRIASGSFDRTARLWDVRSHRLVGDPLRGHESFVLVAFSPDGKTLASGSADGIKLWDVATGMVSGEPLETAGGGVAFSPDGKTLASGSFDRVVRLWDAGTRKPIGQPLHGHTGLVYGVAFSADGRTLASTGENRTVRLWDLPSRQPLGEPLAGHDGDVLRVTFSADNRALVSREVDGGAILWDPILWTTELSDFRQRLCKTVGRNLTRSEWEEFLPDEPYSKTCPQWPLEEATQP